MNELSAQLALLPERLGPHLALVLLSLSVGVGLSLPLALLAIGRPALRWLVLSTSGVVQTVPGLALLALMVPLLDWARRALGADFPAFGFLPAVLALVLYSMQPVLRNAVTGLEGVDPAVLEAAVGVGLSRRQVLLQVQLPLAAPVILAGVRTSAVWTVGTATLSTPVGQTSLGNYIFSGLQTRNFAAVVVGCAATAILALVLDGAAGLLQLASRKRTRGPLLGGAAVLASLVLVAVALAAPGARGVAVQPVRIGAKNFTEQYILAEALAQSLRARGLDVTIAEGVGSTVLFDALVQGELDVVVDYSGTLWANQLRRGEERVSPDVVLEQVTQWLAARKVVSLGALGFENTYAFAMPAARAQALQLTSLEQLAGPIRELRLGSDYEFFSRPEWARVAEVYGLKPKAQISSDPSLMYAAVAAGEVELITAFSTDGRLNAFGLTVLDDPRRAFPPYDAMLLVGPGASQRAEVLEALRGWVGAVDVGLMRRANELVDVEGKSRVEAATWLNAARKADGGR